MQAIPRIACYRDKPRARPEGNDQESPFARCSMISDLPRWRSRSGRHGTNAKAFWFPISAIRPEARSTDLSNLPSKPSPFANSTRSLPERPSSFEAARVSSIMRWRCRALSESRSSPSTIRPSLRRKARLSSRALDTRSDFTPVSTSSPMAHPSPSQRPARTRKALPVYQTAPIIIGIACLSRQAWRPFSGSAQSLAQMATAISSAR
mgnify:CR=1 FL=1